MRAAPDDINNFRPCPMMALLKVNQQQVSLTFAHVFK
jgi:hypothetical protein